MEIPACAANHHQWADRLIDDYSGLYVRVCVNRSCGLIVEGPWHNPALVTRIRERPVRVARPQASKVRAPKAHPSQSRKTRSLIARLFDRDGPGCFYCRCPLAATDATVDHFVPRAAGGTNVFANYRAACWPCNQAKGSMSPTRFLAADRVVQIENLVP